jgi:TolB protein
MRSVKRADLRLLTIAASCATAAVLAVPGLGHNDAARANPAPDTAGHAAANRTEAVAGGSIAGIPGDLYYLRSDSSTDQVTHLNRSGKLTKLGAANWTTSVSPDGRRLAWITEHGKLMVADANGKGAKQLRAKVANAGWGPEWAPDNRRLVIADQKVTSTSTYEYPGVFDTRTKKFTRFPAKLDAVHIHFAGNGKKIAFATGECRLKTANANGTHVRPVPGFGTDNDQVNPKGLYACEPVSVSPDAGRVAVWLHKKHEPAGDITGDVVANGVVDTKTGKVVKLPVKGKVSAVLFNTDGSLVVRSTSAGKTTLTLLSAKLKVLRRAGEPAAARKLDLIAWTR